MGSRVRCWRPVSKRWEREGAVWAGRTRCEPVVDEERLEERLIHAS
ncbi:MAG: hypothetical protein R6V85_11535 [Polyangia bacterium]